MAEQKKQNDKALPQNDETAAVKRGRGRPKGSADSHPRTPGKRPDKTVQTASGDNAKYITNALAVAQFEKVDMNDPEAVAERVQEYFELCLRNDAKPSLSGLALALGTDRRRIWDFREGKREVNPATRDTLKKASVVLDVLMNDYAQNGKINPVTAIFLMRNNFGYTNEQEIVITPANPLGESSDAAKLAEKYGESVVIDGEFDDPTDPTGAE